jgi:predicted RNA-binding protein with PIN domain
VTHWLVDAMNVIGSRPDGWWNDPGKAMRRFAAELDEFAKSTGDDVTVVFDKDPGPLDGAGSIEVVVARWKGRNAADHEIEEIVAAAEDPASLRVVSSDKRLVEKVTELGAKVTSSGRFRARLDEPT